MPAITSLRIRCAATYSVWRGRRLRRAIQCWKEVSSHAQEEHDEFEEQWIKVGAAVATASMRCMRMHMQGWAHFASRSRVVRRAVGMLWMRQLSLSMRAWNANLSMVRMCRKAVEAMQQRWGMYRMADALEMWRGEVKEAAAARERESMAEQLLLAGKDAAMAAEQQRDEAMATAAAAEREVEEARRELLEERERADRVRMSTIAAFGYRSERSLLLLAWTAFAQACTAKILVLSGKRSSAESHRRRGEREAMRDAFAAWRSRQRRAGALKIVLGTIAARSESGAQHCVLRYSIQNRESFEDFPPPANSFLFF